jgi:hypothetical protein
MFRLLFLDFKIGYRSKTSRRVFAAAGKKISSARLSAAGMKRKHLESSAEVARSRGPTRGRPFALALRQASSLTSKTSRAAITVSMGAAPFSKSIELEGALAQPPCQLEKRRFPGN